MKSRENSSEIFKLCECWVGGGGGAVFDDMATVCDNALMCL